jgi:hypothetical protein
MRILNPQNPEEPHKEPPKESSSSPSPDITESSKPDESKLEWEKKMGELESILKVRASVKSKASAGQLQQLVQLQEADEPAVQPSGDFHNVVEDLKRGWRADLQQLQAAVQGELRRAVNQMNEKETAIQDLIHTVAELQESVTQLRTVEFTLPEPLPTPRSFISRLWKYLNEPLLDMPLRKPHKTYR